MKLTIKIESKVELTEEQQVYVAQCMTNYGTSLINYIEDTKDHVPIEFEAVKVEDGN